MRSSSMIIESVRPFNSVTRQSWRIFFETNSSLDYRRTQKAWSIIYETERLKLVAFLADRKKAWLRNLHRGLSFDHQRFMSPLVESLPLLCRVLVIWSRKVALRFWWSTWGRRALHASVMSTAGRLNLPTKSALLKCRSLLWFHPTAYTICSSLVVDTCMGKA